MSRLAAWVILIAAAALTYSLALTGYDHVTGRWESTESGGLTRVVIECPPPWRVLFLGEEPESQRDQGECVLSSRTLMVEAGLVALVGGLLTWRPVTRPNPDSIEPLSRLIGRRD